jgi:putative copper export protein
VYRVTYHAFGADDLHEVAGSIVFGVGTTPTTTGGQVVPPTRPAEAVARAVADLGLGVVAAGMLALWAQPAPASRRPRRRGTDRSIRATVAGGLAGIVAGTGLALVEEARAVGGPAGPTLWRIASSTGPGRQAVLTVEAVAILVALLAVQRPAARRGAALRLPTNLPGAPTPAQLGGVLALLAVAGARSAGGHPGRGIPSGLDAAVLGLHLLAGATWVGSLVILPLVVRTTGLGWAATIRALAPVAEALVLVTVASGLVLAAGRVATVTALLAPGYGWIVLAKTGVVAAAVALGLRMSRSRPHQVGPPGWSRRAEVAAAVVVVGFASWLAATPTANGPSFDDAPARPATAWSGAADDLAVQLQLSPNRPGANLVSVDVHDTRRPSPGQVTSVLLTGVGSPDDGDAVGRPSGAGRWDLGSVTLGSGDVPLVVTITRPGLPEAQAALTWAVPPPPPPVHRPIVSTARLRPGLDVAALVGVLTGAFLLRRRHHQLEATDAHHPDPDRAPDPAPGPTPRRLRHPRRPAGRPGLRGGTALVGRRP